MFKKLIIVPLLLLLLNCFNGPTINLSVKSCNFSFDEVQKQLPDLKFHKANLYIQIKDGDIGNDYLSTVLKKAKALEIPTIIWPLLETDQGPWANEFNYEIFGELVNKITDYLKEEEINPKYIVINMENSSAQMDTITNYLKNKDYKAIMELLMTNLDRASFDRGVAGYKKIVDDLHAKGYQVMITTYPFMIDDFKDGDPDIQDLANVPISGIDWDALTFTPYRTAYSGDFGMTFTPYIVYDYGKAAKEIFKEKARIALGIVGESGHGPGFKSPEDLKKDIAAAKAAGIEQIDLFHLKGMVESGDIGPWINADVEAEIPVIDLKVVAARAFVQTLDKVLNDKYTEQKIPVIMNVLDSLKVK